VIGTIFAVMLGFVILLALQSYQRAREGSSVEAIAVRELHYVAGVFRAPSSDRLRADWSATRAPSSRTNGPR
jgi:hypothetical protein